MLKVRWLFAGALICTLAGLTAYHAVGQEKKDGDAEEKKAEANAKAAENLATAYTLIQYGRENKTPEALVAAAILLHRTPAEKYDDKEGKFEGGEDIKPEDPQELLKEAGLMRAKDKALTDYVAKVADDLKEEARGSFPGKALFIYRTIPAGGSVKGTHSFFRNKLPALVRVVSLPQISGGFPPKFNAPNFVSLRVTDSPPPPAKGSKQYYFQPSRLFHAAIFVPSKAGVPPILFPAPVYITVGNQGKDTAKVLIATN